MKLTTCEHVTVIPGYYFETVPVISHLATDQGWDGTLGIN